MRYKICGHDFLHYPPILNNSPHPGSNDTILKVIKHYSYAMFPTKLRTAFSLNLTQHPNSKILFKIGTGQKQTYRHVTHTTTNTQPSFPFILIKGRTKFKRLLYMLI